MTRHRNLSSRFGEEKVTKLRKKVTKLRKKVTNQVTKSNKKVTKSNKKVTKSKTLTLKKCHCLISKGILSISVQFLEPPQRSWNALVYPIRQRTVSVTSHPLLLQDICR